MVMEYSDGEAMDHDRMDKSMNVSVDKGKDKGKDKDKDKGKGNGEQMPKFR